MLDTSPRNIRVTVSYDGTDFRGYQIQNDGRTVQGEIERGLEKLFGTPIRVAAAGRTDSGVHARGQVISFPLDHRGIEGRSIAAALNSRLPRDIAALESTDADPSFHARYSAVQRVYRYYLYPGAVRDPLRERYSWRVNRVPDVRLMNSYATCLVGTHDFSLFASSRDVSDRRERSIDHAVFTPQRAYLVFEIAARSFMWHMVRSIVGTLLALERTGESPEKLLEMVRQADRSLAGETAPANGLEFHQVIYSRNDMRIRGRPALSKPCAT